MACKIKGLPPAPKASASEESLKRWIQKAKNIQKENKMLMAKERRRQALISKIKKMTKRY